jgi:hypothetical protein
VGKGLPVVEDKCRLLGSELHRGVVGAGLIAPRMDGGDTAEYPVVVNRHDAAADVRTDRHPVEDRLADLGADAVGQVSCPAFKWSWIPARATGLRRGPGRQSRSARPQNELTLAASPRVLHRGPLQMVTAIKQPSRCLWWVENSYRRRP